MTKSSTKRPNLGKNRLTSAHVQNIHAWLGKKPLPNEIRRLQQDISAWTPEQKGLPEKQAGIDGLWRATKIVRCAGELDTEDEIDYDDIKALEQQCRRDDATQTYSDEITKLYYFLEIRDQSFREIDACTYPMPYESSEMDYGTFETVTERSEDEIKGGIVYDYGGFEHMIRFDPQGFAKIKSVAASRTGKRTRVVLHQNATGDGVMVDKALLSKGILQRTAFLLWDGVYPSWIDITYERFALPANESKAPRKKRA